MINAADLFRKIYRHQLPLLQMMSNDLVGTFHTGLDTTKCLNTAVMMMYLLGGEKGVRKAFFCSVDRVGVRYSNLFDRDAVVSYYLQKLFKGLLAAAERPALHYVMLTDAALVEGRGATTQQPQSFPGHVFVIERTGEASWILHQSYINSYKMESVPKDRGWILDFCRQLTLFMVTSEWNGRCSDFWSFLTHVDGDRFEGHRKTEILLCYQKLDLRKSGARFRGYLRSKLETIDSMLLERGERANEEVYGDPGLYRIGIAKGIYPASNSRIRASIAELLDDEPSSSSS